MYSLVLAAAEREAPLIDIDGTVLLQFGIFVTMAIVLYALVFKPYLKVRDDRDAGIAGARDEARKMEERAASGAAELEARLAAARTRGAAERLKLRTEAETHERELLGVARDTANAAVAKGRAQALAEGEAARVKLVADAQTLAHEVATRLLGRPL